MMPESPIVIACSTDQRYAQGLAVMMRSLLDHHAGTRAIELYILETDLPEDTKNRLLSSWNDPRLHVTFLKPDTSVLTDLTQFNNVHQAMYFYLTLPTLLPQHKKILKMDADMLVLSEIEELWNTDLGDHPMAAAQELRSPLVSSDWALPNYRELGISPEEKYCNAGLMLLHLDLWRTDKIAEKIIHHTKRYEKIIRYWDQDGVNATLAGKWLQLDPVWNVEAEGLMMTGWVPDDSLGIPDIIARAKIIHFVCYKPWDKDCKHPKTALFRQYLGRTAFV